MKIKKTLTNTIYTYGTVAIVLHWVMAAMIIGLFILGLYMTGLDYAHPWNNSAPHLHESLGIIVLGLLIVRTLWTFVNVKPSLEAMPGWERIAARAVHLAFYFLMFSIALSGYLIPTADGRAIKVFNWFKVPALVTITRQEDFAGKVHYTLAICIIALTILHALAALKHHFMDKDDTLTRMLGIRKK